MKKQILTIIIIILAGVVVFALVQSIRTGIVSEKGPVGSQKEVEKPEVPKETEMTEAPAEEEGQMPSKTESELKLQARAFIQTYGTYSSDSGYANLVGLLDFMTDKLRQETQARIDSGVDKSEGFFSIIVKVGSIETLSFMFDARALFTAQTQVQEMKKGETKLSQQIVDVLFIKVGDDWLVDDIEFK
ncbi:hypothetical protein MYX07_00530 [Patescibacteria group bacterium AH-259-L07]|nr:hypothetical protein [Patescibacteria group bacterium AH-259-L07]